VKREAELFRLRPRASTLFVKKISSRAAFPHQVARFMRLPATYVECDAAKKRHAREPDGQRQRSGSQALPHALAVQTAAQLSRLERFCVAGSPTLPTVEPASPFGGGGGGGVLVDAFFVQSAGGPGARPAKLSS
jgi:hypothetical protein